MWLMTILRLMLEMWAPVQGCGGFCNQGRGICKCKERKR